MSAGKGKVFVLDAQMKVLDTINDPMPYLDGDRMNDPAYMKAWEDARDKEWRKLHCDYPTASMLAPMMGVSSC
jgi:hypothetical protein